MRLVEAFFLVFRQGGGFSNRCVSKKTELGKNIKLEISSFFTFLHKRSIISGLKIPNLLVE